MFEIILKFDACVIQTNYYIIYTLEICKKKKKNSPSNNLFVKLLMQELKDMHFAEHKRLMDLLDTEREQILIEKTKLETMERIKPTSSNPSTKRQTELDAAIKIAQVSAFTTITILNKSPSSITFIS